MVEIKAGAELDRAVAEAAGMIFDVSDGQVELLMLSEDDSGIAEAFLFAPSTDLNAAFFAAEKVFNYEFALYTPGNPSGGWKRFRCIVGIGWSGESSVSKFEVTADTPALAICAAILELSKVKQS